MRMRTFLKRLRAEKDTNLNYFLFIYPSIHPFSQVLDPPNYSSLHHSTLPSHMSTHSSVCFHPLISSPSHLYIHPFVHPPTYPFTHSSIQASLHPLCPSIQEHINLSIHPFIHSFIHSPIYICIHQLSMQPPGEASVNLHLSVHHPAVHPSIYSTNFLIHPKYLATC